MFEGISINSNGFFNIISMKYMYIHVLTGPGIAACQCKTANIKTIDINERHRQDTKQGRTTPVSYPGTFCDRCITHVQEETFLISFLIDCLTLIG